MRGTDLGLVEGHDHGQNADPASTENESATSAAEIRGPGREAERDTHESPATNLPPINIPDRS